MRKVVLIFLNVFNDKKKKERWQIRVIWSIIKLKGNIT